MRGNSRHSALRPAGPGGAGRPGGARPGAGARSGAGVRPGETHRAGGPADTQLLAGLLEPAVSALGMDLEGVRVTSAGRRKLLRIVVDADGGVSLDDIERISRELSAVLDETAAMGEAPYTLEVSSPGVDRPLTEPRHWRRAAGRLVTAPLTPQPQAPVDEKAGPVTVRGRVIQADASGVTLDVQGDCMRFGYGDLGPGRIQIEFARLDDGPDDGADEEDPDGY